MTLRIIAEVSRLIGRPFVKNRGQSLALIDGATEDSVIAALPAQLASLQESVAMSFDELRPEDIPPYVVAPRLRLNAAIKNRGGSLHYITKGLPWRGLVELGELVGRKKAQAELPEGMELYPEIDAIYRDVFGPDRAVDPEGFVFWMMNIRQGKVTLTELAAHLRASKEYQIQMGRVGGSE